MLEAGKVGGFVNYRWNNGFMQSFVRTVRKQGKTFIIGAGFFPTSAAYQTEQLVTSAVKFGMTHSAKQLFDAISNPLGMFIHGDVYLYAYDFDGNVVGHGESLELVGQNVLESTTLDGKLRTRDIIDIARKNPGYGWYTYRARQGGVEKRAYVERFVDPVTGRKYAIVGGYYPSIDDTTVQSFVKRAGNYLRSHGAQQSFPEFSKKVGDFSYGPLTLFVYSPEGVMLADSANPAFVGINLMNSRDSEGKYITRSIIDHANRFPHGGWLGFSMRNSYALMYVEKIQVPDGDFIIGATYFPSEKYIHVRFMVDKALLYLQAHSAEEAFNMFASRDPDFLRGDVYVFVYNSDGFVLVDGQDRSHIWGQDGLRDNKERLVSERIIAIANSGGGWFEFSKNNATARVYVKQVVKEAAEGPELKEGPEQTLIVGSMYYL